MLSNWKILVSFCWLPLLMYSSSLFAQGAQTDPAITQVALDTANQMDKSHPKVVPSGPPKLFARECTIGQSAFSPKDPPLKPVFSIRCFTDSQRIDKSDPA